MEKEKVLNDIGLSKNEARVYLALLKLGKTTATKIAGLSEVHRVNVYDSIKKLQSRGLVSNVTVDDKQYFQAADPNMLIRIIENQKTKVECIIDQLKLDHSLSITSNVQLYNGISAFRNILKSFMDSGLPRYVFGVPLIASKLIGREFMNSYHAERIRRKIPMRHIYNSDAKERITYLNKLDLTEARYLNPEYDSPVATSVCGNKVALTTYGDNTVTIFIDNEVIADAYRKYFDILWDKANKE